MALFVRDNHDHNGEGRGLHCLGWHLFQLNAKHASPPNAGTIPRFV